MPLAPPPCARSSRLVRFGQRIVVTVAIALVLLGTGAAPASAHSVGGVGSTNYVSKILAITPPIAGVSAKIVEAGGRVEVTSTRTELTIPGYNGEPYLRIGPKGVFENVRSPAVYLNRTRKATDPGSGKADADAPPEWNRIGDGPSYAWHDHNIHWMGDKDPPAVRASPDRYHLLYGDGGVVSQTPWKISLSGADGSSSALTGTLAWVPGPSPVPWYGAAIAVGLVCVAAGATRRWALALGGLLAVAIAVDGVHGFAIGFDYAGPFSTQLLKAVTGSAYSLPGWVIGAVGVRLLLKRSIDGLYATVFAGLCIALFGGLLDISSLRKTEIPFALGPNPARITVTLALGMGLGLALGAIVAVRRNPEADPDELDEDDLDELAAAPA